MKLNGLQTTYEYNLIFLCSTLNREMKNYSHVQSFFETFPEIFMWKRHSNITIKSAPFASGVDFKALRLQRNFLIILHWQSKFYEKSNKKSWQRDEACPLIKQERSKRMDIEEKTPAKTLIIQSHLHLSSNNEWLAEFI